MNLKDEIDTPKDWNKKDKQTKKESKKTFEDVNKLLTGRQEILNGFENKIFPIKKPTHLTGHPCMLVWSTLLSYTSWNINS